LRALVFDERGRAEADILRVEKRLTCAKQVDDANVASRRIRLRVQHEIELLLLGGHQAENTGFDAEEASSTDDSKRVICCDAPRVCDNGAKDTLAGLRLKVEHDDPLDPPRRLSDDEAHGVSIECERDDGGLVRRRLEGDVLGAICLVNVGLKVSEGADASKGSLARS
jgi:hypothetical protein